jgi:hypothetical protein
MSNQRFKKMLIRAKKNFITKFNTGIAEFHADFKSVEKVLKKCTKKGLIKNVTEICPFSLLLMFVKLVLLITFFGVFFYNFFNGFEISVKFCVF